MTTEYIDIIDTAVKIGLGALISGLATYYVTRLNHKKELERESRIRKLNIIEEAAKHIDEYIYAFVNFISAINGAHKNYPSRKVFDYSNEGDQITWDYILKLDNEFCDKREQKLNALSKLHLLGLSSVANSLSELDELDITVRNLVMFENNIPETKTTDAWNSEIKKIKDNFYKIISEHYRGVEQG